MTDAAAKILVVEDEPAIREMLAFSLKGGGFELDEVADAEAGQRQAVDDPPDLILLDLMLPGMNGTDLARRLKADERTRHIPIIMLTARTEEEDRVRGLDVGADDYVTKPFSPRELLARINAVLRRYRSESTQLEADGLTLDTASYRVYSGEQTIALGPTEFRLLRFLMEHPDRVFSREQLLDRVWGANVYVEDRTVDVHVRRLRKALEPTGHTGLVQTVRGVGYRFSTRPE